MAAFEWVENSKTIRIKPPTRTKKLTGTRFAAIFNANNYETPFSIWCAVTKTYEEPYEETKYTKAGKIIEPKQLAYCKKVYFMDVHTPTDEYGADYFNKTFGDFFPETPIFGGMWDSLVNKDGKPVKVIECKTTKRSEDWKDGKIPEYYALQAALYAYLLGIDEVIMVVSFLEESDYDHPEKYIPTVKNTVLVPFKVSERYPQFDKLLEYATDWWDRHVKTGISPAYDEENDKKVLAALRTKVIDTSKVGIEQIIAEIEQLTDEIAKHDQAVEEKKKRLTTLKESLSLQMQKSFVPGDKKVQVEGKNYTFSCSKSMSEGIDKNALQSDGLLKKYTTFTPKFTLTLKKKSEEK